MKKLLLSIAIAAAVMSIGVQVFAAMEGTASGDSTTESGACQAAKNRAYNMRFGICIGGDIRVSSCNCSQESNGRWSCFVEYGCNR